MTSDDELTRRCESEPIHIPGAIQPHGVLLVVDDTGVIRVASGNHAELGSLVVEPIGRNLDEVVGPEAGATIRFATDGDPTSASLASGERVDIVIHRARSSTLVEIERSSAVEVTDQAGLSRLLRALQGATTPSALLGEIVLAVRTLTGFDRVMIYQFDDDWNGTVVAESVADGHGAFLGLRYPATDIPPQARALYLRNRVRLIPDVNGSPVDLAVDPDFDEVPVDLSDATLRAVSPVHLEYLHNMGVAASASIALTVQGRLWGLVACHHYSGPRRPSQRIRSSLDVLAATASALLAGLLALETSREMVGLGARLDLLAAPLLDESVADPIVELSPEELVGLVDADSAVIRATGSPLMRAGGAPPTEQVSRLIAWLVDHDHRELISPHLAGVLDPDDGWSELLAEAAGMIAIRWGGEGDWVMWFRQEQLRSVRWGGDPTAKEIVQDPLGDRLGPRRSFDEFVETVGQTCRAWTDPEIAIARQLAVRLDQSVTRRTRRNRGLAVLLQRALLLDDVPDVPGVDVGVLYRPAEDDALGGDWHDVYFLPGGRSVVALGDVAGHGFEVAASMAQIRHALRAYAIREPDIGDAVSRLNELAFTLLPGELASLVIALVDPGRGTLEVVNVGHLPPVVARSTEPPALLELPRQPALGVSRTASYSATRITLDPGDTMVLCSDGLIERRSAPLDEQLARLVAAVGEVASEPTASICRSLFDRFAPDGSDDTTVLALRFEQPPADEG